MTIREAVQYSLDWRDKVIAIGDSTLTRKFETMIYSGSDEVTLDFFVYLLESISDALD